MERKVRAACSWRAGLAGALSPRLKCGPLEDVPCMSHSRLQSSGAGHFSPAQLSPVFGMDTSGEYVQVEYVCKW